MTPDPFPKDITEGVISGIDVQPVTHDQTGTAGPQPGSTNPGISIPPPAPAEKDHAGIALLDIAISESVRYCEREGYPAPNMALWDGFSRGFLNKALWHYFPDGSAPDSPIVCALIGIAGLAVCYTPVIIAFYDKKQKDAKEQDEKANNKRIDEHNRKVAQLRAQRRAAGQDPNTGEPLTSRAPAQDETTQEPEQTEPEIPATPAAKDPEWFMTTAPPVPAIARRIEAAEPAAPGMG